MLYLMKFSGLRRSSNPYLDGVTPRRGFAGRDEIIKRNSIRDKREFNPEWKVKAA